MTTVLKKNKAFKALACSNNVTVKSLRIRNDKIKCLTHNRTLPKSLALLVTVHKSFHGRHIPQYRHECGDNYVSPAFFVVIYYYRNRVTYYTNVECRAYKFCGRYTIIHPLYLPGTFIMDIIQTYCIVFREVNELEHWFYWCCGGTIPPYLYEPAVSRYSCLLFHLHWISCPPMSISKTVRMIRGCIKRCGRF
jgi:hypothetical protein